MNGRRPTSDVEELGVDRAMEIALEIAPPYDVSDVTSQLGARRMMDTLATLIDNGHLGTRVTKEQRERAEQKRNRALSRSRAERVPGRSGEACCPARTPTRLRRSGPAW